MIGVFGGRCGGDEIGEGPACFFDSGYGKAARGGGIFVVGDGSGFKFGGEARGKWRVNDLVGFGGEFDAFEDEFLLSRYHFGYSGEVYGGVDVAFHNGASVVVFDETLITCLRHLDCLSKWS